MISGMNSNTGMVNISLFSSYPYDNKTVNAYITGIPYAEKHGPMFIHNGSIDKSFNATINGKVQETALLFWYTLGNSGSTKSANIYVENLGRGSGGLNAYMSATYKINNNRPFYINANPTQNSGGSNLFIRSSVGEGSFELTDSLDMRIFSSGNPVTLGRDFFINSSNTGIVTDSFALTVYHDNQPIKTLPLTIKSPIGQEEGVLLYVKGLRENEDLFDPYTFDLEDGGIPKNRSFALSIRSAEGKGVPMVLGSVTYKSGIIPLYIGSNLVNTGILPCTIISRQVDDNFNIFTHGK